VVLTTSEAYSSALRLRLSFHEIAGRTTDLEIQLASAERIQSQLESGESHMALVVGEPSSQLWAAAIANVPIHLIVNLANPLAEIDQADLRGIYAGGLTNWQAVGGLSDDIRVMTQDSQLEAARVFKRDVLAEGQIGGGAIVTPSGWAMAQAVGDDPAAIGYLLCNDSTPRTRSLRIVGEELPASGEASVTLFAIAARPPTGAELDFLVWAQSPPGQWAVLANCGD
jgi:DNA-binding transcriptional LysR family regulator